jgi:hypothetical protein
MAKFWISQSTGCWVDLFEGRRFTGRRLRLFGPADFVNLRVAADDWGREIGSVIVGPGAYAQCFLEVNLRDSVVWLVPNQQVAEVSDLPTEDDLDSIRLFDRPPFASEPGFEAYEAWHGLPRP